MSKRHTKKLRARAENGGKLAGLQKALAELDRFCDTLLDVFVTRAVSQLGKNVSYKIVMCGAGARLGRFDEQAYDVYATLIGHYKNITALYDQNMYSAPHDPGRAREPANAAETAGRAREIADGIISIISSRVKFSEENGGLSVENPINAEKNKLVTGILQEFYREYKLVSKDEFHNEIAAIKARHKHSLVTSFGHDSARAAFDEILGSTDLLSRPTYTIYCKKCQSLVAMLNDLNLRTSANYYFRLLEAEKDIIESIVKIQISALEREFVNAQASDRPDEPQRIAVNKFLQTIQECYQLFMKDAGHILSELRQATCQDDDPRTHIADNFENYHADLTLRLAGEQSFPLAALELAQVELPALLAACEHALTKALQAVIERKIARPTLDRTLYELRKNVTQATIMADEMAAVFQKAQDFAHEHESSLATEPGIEIIKGINETTGIKIMNIQDGKQSFSDEALQRLLKLRDDGRALCETLLKNTVADVAKSLLEISLSNCAEIGVPDNVSACLEKAFDEVYERDFSQRIDKTVSSWQSEINKQIVSFKRQVLLYEMGTFDEIMNFSVTKLVEDAGEFGEGSQSPSMSYAEHLRHSQSDLVEILGRNGITRILPQPHDPFDGKEHDVLMAERAEGFTKGEIVKTYSSGYKEHDTVLVRASVIAAK